MIGQRLMVYDATCTGPKWSPGLTHAWWVGSHLYRSLDRLDACFGARSWEQALAWLALQPGPIAEIQYWGHGKWGNVWIAGDCLDQRDFLRDGRHRQALQTIRDKMAGPTSLLWLRTCESFGAVVGGEFAATLADYFGSRVAGHTYIIGPWQSGLHSLAAGHAAYWSPEEGLAKGTARSPERAHASSPRAPNTITCLHGRVPIGF